MNTRSKVMELLSRNYYSVVEKLNGKNKGYAVVCEDKDGELHIFKIYKTYSGAKNFILKISDERKFCIIDFTKTELYMLYWSLNIKGTVIL